MAVLGLLVLVLVLVLVRLLMLQLPVQRRGKRRVEAHRGVEGAQRHEGYAEGFCLFAMLSSMWNKNAPPSLSYVLELKSLKSLILYRNSNLSF